MDTQIPILRNWLMIIGGGWSNNVAGEMGGRIFRFSAHVSCKKQRISFPPPLITNVITSSSAIKQLRRLKILRLHCYDDDISRTLERIQSF